MDRDRTEIVIIISDMLENPDSSGIFPTSTAYTRLEHYIQQERIQAIGCAHAACCIALDSGEDPRTIEVPVYLDGVLKSLDRYKLHN